ncbi:Ribosomal RNA large subunit methyltransferase I (23S rRNA m5C1962 methyltransferase) (rRNA (cytosine-C(5)-)-methyltransferase RlmI) [Durusdinium trenchii]|uniref:Ribosomal RNA large subunit methyltransferase I (23S rRNA m5C1962 methyltransferase) (rRNA (cytosine-C(5)-)-methyltransferase RlmI) n=1 Tax=Durusdinium trenchii TaxID=1381693 RepID=A0ABP0MZU3_9DINO
MGRDGLAPHFSARLFAEPFYRLAHGEADHLPGLVIDRYDDHLCIQPFSGLDELLWPIADALDEVLKPKVVIIRQDTPGRRREKAALKREVLKGSYQGPSELREHGASFAVDLLSGQKTGWYYDQRENRLMLANLVRGSLPRVLDVYSYVGGFGVLLAHYGAASVLCVDSSEAALELLRRSAAMNAVQSCVRSIRADAMDFLQEKSRQKAAGEDLEDSEFDLVILDPPNLGVDRLTASKALRHYEKLVTAAASLCAPGGMLFVASCTFSIGERELMGVCHRSLAWLQRDYRLVSSGAQAGGPPANVPLLAALAPQLQQRLSADQLRAPHLAQVCGAYCHARFLESTHVTVILEAARFTLKEATPLELTRLVRAGIRAKAANAELVIKEAAWLAGAQAEVMLPHELARTAGTFGGECAAFLAASDGGEVEAVEAFAALGSPRRWWKGGIAWKKGWMRMIQRLMDEIGVEATGEALRFDMS